MKTFHEYWTFSAIRGAMTVLAAIAILAIPQATSSMLSLPVFVALAIDCLATYSIFDGAVMILLAKLLPARASNRKVLYGQAAGSVVIGILLYLVTYGALNLRWLLWIVVAQAGVAAMAELLVASDTHQQYGCLSCYATSLVLVFCAVALPFARTLDAVGMSFALASYVGLYGASELLLGGRMLFVEYRSGHPASVASEAWRAEMLKPAAPSLIALADRKVCASCAACPADGLCHDDSLAGQVARVSAERRPAIVLTMRVHDLLKSAHQVRG
jgi:hypothetical protein